MEGEPRQPLVGEYKERLDKLTLNVSDAQLVDFMDEIHKKKSDLETIYGEEEIRKYRLFHVLAGSTPMPDQEFVADDVAGGDSIAVFIEGLEKKYGTG